MAIARNGVAASPSPAWLLAGRPAPAKLQLAGCAPGAAARAIKPKVTARLYNGDHGVDRMLAST